MRSVPLKIIARNSSPAVPPDETNLVAAAQRGDHEAFHQIYDHYRDRIFNLISYSLCDPQQVEDVFQTVFLKIFRSLPFFRGESSLLTWMYQIALNTCKNTNRNRSYWTPLSAIYRQPQEQDPKPTPDIVHYGEDRSRAIRLAISRLKPKYREIVVLKYQEGLSYEEIGAILSVSAGTVASRLHRALKLLKSLL